MESFACFRRVALNGAHRSGSPAALRLFALEFAIPADLTPLWWIAILESGGHADLSVASLPRNLHRPCPSALAWPAVHAERPGRRLDAPGAGTGRKGSHARRA